MTTEEKFHAAVNVIRHLPKHGPVQPSNSTALKFYAYFKQANEGPNRTAKPAFWDLVKKAKWDAWTKLGDMNREIAMQLYVEEFKKTVESVSTSSANIDQEEIDNFYATLPMKDLELLIGPVVTKSCSTFPINEETIVNTLPVNNPVETTSQTSASETHISYGVGKAPYEEDEDEYFQDTIENADMAQKNSAYLYMNGHLPSVSGDTNSKSDLNCYNNDDRETISHLTRIVTCLQKDLEKVGDNVKTVEQRIGQLQRKVLMKKNQCSILQWPTTMLAVFIAWPVLLQLIIYWFRRRNM